MKKKKISIFGATGSIGKSTADVILASPEKFEVQTISANKNAEFLAKQAKLLGAKKAVIIDEEKLGELKRLLEGSDIEALGGANEIQKAASEDVDVIMAAMVGFAGLKPIIAALENGTDVAIANKEPLVAAGEMIVTLAKENNAKLLPVDSEHNAIFQVFEKENKSAIDRLILTASGGPFLRKSITEIDNATVEEAIAHPNWSMGKKISVDSATMMNKALEIIEAAHLFDMPTKKIEVLIHPQSVVHSIVSYKDGSMLSQMGASDMKTPIANALGYPARLKQGGEILDLTSISGLTFEKPDLGKFPALGYAYKCLDLGQAACISLNAANEVAVESFLNKRIKFGDIMRCIDHAINAIYPDLPNFSLKTVEEIENLDTIVRQKTNSYICSLS